MTKCEVRLLNDVHATPALAYVEAESFDLCRAALLLSGDAVKGKDGYFYNREGQRVVICYTDPEVPLGGVHVRYGYRAL